MKNISEQINLIINQNDMNQIQQQQMMQQQQIMMQQQMMNFHEEKNFLRKNIIFENAKTNNFKTISAKYGTY